MHLTKSLQCSLGMEDNSALKTIVLDMESTLLHAVVRDDRKTVSLTFRPYLGEFLAMVLGHFDVYIWIAGKRNYALECIQHMVEHYKLPCAPHLITRDDGGWYQGGCGKARAVTSARGRRTLEHGGQGRVTSYLGAVTPLTTGVTFANWHGKICDQQGNPADGVHTFTRFPDQFALH